LNKFLKLFANVLSAIIKLIIYVSVFYLGIIAYIMAYQLLGLVPSLLIIPVILFALPFAVLIEVAIFRLLIPKPRIGVHKIGGWIHFLYLLNNRVFNLSVNPVFPPFAALYKNSDIFRVLTMKSLGAKIKFSSKIGFTTRIHDPYLLTIGSQATIDEGVQIFSFALEIGKIILHRVFIGPKSHVSAASLIFPGTDIGEGSVLGMGSSTRNDMKIPQYELWVGTPASHLSKLSRPLLYTASHSKEQKGFQEHKEYRDRDHRDHRDNRDRGYGRGGYGDKRGGRSFDNRPDRDRGRFGGRRPDGRFDKPRYGDQKRGGFQRPKPQDRNFSRPPGPAPTQTPTPTPSPAPSPAPSAAPAQTPTPTPAPAPKPVVDKEKPTENPYIGPISRSPKPEETKPPVQKTDDIKKDNTQSVNPSEPRESKDQDSSKEENKEQNNQE
jgi:acetyltransferase-like isoleucine patch superfamily enzyme